MLGRCAEGVLQLKKRSGLGSFLLSVLSPSARSARESAAVCASQTLGKNKKLKDERVMEGRGWWAEWTVEAPRPSEAGRLTE